MLIDILIETNLAWQQAPNNNFQLSGHYLKFSLSPKNITEILISHNKHSYNCCNEFSNVKNRPFKKTQQRKFCYFSRSKVQETFISFGIHSFTSIFIKTRVYKIWIEGHIQFQLPTVHLILQNKETKNSFFCLFASVVHSLNRLNC